MFGLLDKILNLKVLKNLWACKFWDCILYMWHSPHTSSPAHRHPFGLVCLLLQLCQAKCNGEHLPGPAKQYTVNGKVQTKKFNQIAFLFHD